MLLARSDSRDCSTFGTPRSQLQSSKRQSVAKCLHSRHTSSSAISSPLLSCCHTRQSQTIINLMGRGTLMAQSPIMVPLEDDVEPLTPAITVVTRRAHDQQSSSCSIPFTVTLVTRASMQRHAWEKHFKIRTTSSTFPRSRVCSKASVSVQPITLTDARTLRHWKKLRVWRRHSMASWKGFSLPTPMRRTSLNASKATTLLVATAHLQLNCQAKLLSLLLPQLHPHRVIQTELSLRSTTLI